MKLKKQNKTIEVPHIHSIDLANLLKAGWREENGSALPAIAEEVPIEPQTREQELQSFHWSQIKALADDLGIEKEENEKWGDLIPQILEAEGSRA